MRFIEPEVEPMPTAKATTREITAPQIVAQLETLAKPNYKRILLTHGIEEPVLGVSIEELKKILKRTGPNHALALALYDTGIYDAMYLAGLMANACEMTKRDLTRWVNHPRSASLCGTIIAGVAAESPLGYELALSWIDAKKPHVVVAGWTTLTNLVSITPDTDLDLPELKRLLGRIAKAIHSQQDAVRYAMNGFVIGVGCFVAPLSDAAMNAAEKIGPVQVDMGPTACKVPFAPDYIRKVRDRGTLGKKRKAARC
jgi:3-methyladenine DNA glycosylase AlkD